MRHHLGYALIASPFVGLAVLCVADIGWIGLFKVLGTMAAVIAPIAAGGWLLGGRA